MEIKIITTSIVKSHYSEIDFHKEIKEIKKNIGEYATEVESLYTLGDNRNYYSQYEKQNPSSSKT